MTLRINLKKKKSKYIKYKISPTIDLLDPLCCGMEIKGDYLYIKESVYPFKWSIPLDDIVSIKLLKRKV